MVNHISAQIPDRITHLEIGSFGHHTTATCIAAIAIGAFEHLIVEERYITTYRVIEIAYMILPLQFQIKASVQNFTGIDILVRGTTHRRSRNRREHIGGFLAIPIQTELQAIAQETSLQTEVKLRRTFPAQISISQL